MGLLLTVSDVWRTYSTEKCYLIFSDGFSREESNDVEISSFFIST